MQKNIQVKAKIATELQTKVLNDSALEFLYNLHKKFDQRRLECLKIRQERQLEIDQQGLNFLSATESIRGGDWHVAAAPKDLQDRRVEITGPVDRKMVINALNSGAKVFMADFEDANSPTWENCLQGQLNLQLAIRRNIDFTAANGKKYQLNDEIATLVVRPRGWHLVEKHIEIDENPISASLFDFGLYFFHNAKERINRGSGPYFYLPKLESHIEARLWNDVFNYAQDALNIPKGSIRATVLIETLPAAFEMEEILYELREHASGLNAGRWDYIFSAIKRLRNRNNTLLPDRDQVTMTVPFMRAYTKLLVKSCHQHGAHAMGGMAAFIPNRKDPTVTEKALAKVLEDKMREANDGFDGTWVAHPDLVAVARQAFDKKLADKPNQIQRLRDDVQVDATQLTDLRIPNAKITQVGMRHNISVAIQYINQWLSGTGAVALYNLMEDAATAEICRAQLWQWINQQATFADGVEITKTIYQKMADEVVAELKNLNLNYLDTSRKLLDDLVLTERFIEFLTIPAYEKLISLHAD